MKRLALILISLLVSFTLTNVALAENKEKTGQSNMKYSQDKSKQHQSGQQALTGNQGDFISANRYIGWNIKDTQNEDFGEVTDLLIDPESGRVSFAVISKGGILGVGENYYTVPFSALQRTDGGNSLALNIDANKLDNAPQRRPGESDMEYSRQIHEHYGISPAWDESGSRQMNQMRDDSKSRQMNQMKDSKDQKKSN